jgi:hypothetical protein
VRPVGQGHAGYRKLKAQIAEAEHEGPASAVERALTASGRLQRPGEFDAVGQSMERPQRVWLHQVPQL